MSRLVRGDRLRRSSQLDALDHFQGRHTGEHTPRWVLHDSLARPRYRTDRQWLANNYFWCTSDDRVDRRVDHTLQKPPGAWKYEKAQQNKKAGTAPGRRQADGLIVALRQAAPNQGTGVPRKAAGK